MHIHTHTHTHTLKYFGFVLVIAYKIKKNHFVSLWIYEELDNKWEVKKNFKYGENYVWDKYKTNCSNIYTHNDSEMSLVDEKKKK